MMAPTSVITKTPNLTGRQQQNFRERTYTILDVVDLEEGVLPVNLDRCGFIYEAQSTGEEAVQSRQEYTAHQFLYI